jgi:hypothetical protein
LPSQNAKLVEVAGDSHERGQTPVPLERVCRFAKLRGHPLAGALAILSVNIAQLMEHPSE